MEMGKETYIEFSLSRSDWNRLKKWVDNYDNVIVVLDTFPKACLINFSRLFPRKGNHRLK